MHVRGFVRNCVRRGRKGSKRMDRNEIEDCVGMLRSWCLGKKLFWTRRFDPFS